MSTRNLRSRLAHIEAKRPPKPIKVIRAMDGLTWEGGTGHPAPYSIPPDARLLSPEDVQAMERDYTLIVIEYA